ncbi:hypothetical protein SLNSH_20665 [Alsobacter soli]|uniref:Inositolphosphotransferase Aur1/Ipt1 domain-containing protein n=1 Tax=Alsobacter soli TaxID=2109933 RepID=A0A2T1HN03_9HYPH|nr:phosphatase PAP2 family protein [Alsobacter soli]PSC03044.1 hypothetical protein SLNSH_20665 [Alsobacter soli]
MFPLEARTLLPLVAGLAAAVLMIPTSGLDFTPVLRIPAGLVAAWILMQALLPKARSERELRLLKWITLLIYFALAVNCGFILFYCGQAWAAFPLRDEMFLAADRLLGFDWVLAGPWMNQHAAVTSFFLLVYAVFPAFVVAPLFILPLLGRMGEAEFYVRASMIAELVFAIASCVAPAVSAATALGAQAQANSTLALSAFSGPIVESLRSGALTTIDAFEGIGTFPSYHTAGSVLAVIALWGVPWLRGFAVALAAAEIASAVWVGGHYLIDLPAGALMACAAAYAAGWRWAPEAAETLAEPAPERDSTLALRKA